MAWQYFYGNQQKATPLKKLPDCPPWRQFLPETQVPKKDEDYWKGLRQLAQRNQRAIKRGRSFRIPETEAGKRVIDAVNAAIHLRRPLLITGAPGSGKTSLAYAIAYELALGPVLAWPITARANLTDALYRYDAIARLQDAQLDSTRKGGKKKEEGDLGDYIQLGPVGTAFLPSRLPRVLLIDEIDKSDLNLPNDLLNLFEEGEFEIPELARRKRQADEMTVRVRTADSEEIGDPASGEQDDADAEKSNDIQAILTQPITGGKVKCCAFPIVIMTSNGERDFPPAFHRRCLRLTMPAPTAESLIPVVRSHFEEADPSGWSRSDENLKALIGDFLGDEKEPQDRATDQLLNAIYLLTRSEPPSEVEMVRLKKLLLKKLSELG